MLWIVFQAAFLAIFIGMKCLSSWWTRWFLIVLLEMHDQIILGWESLPRRYFQSWFLQNYEMGLAFEVATMDMHQWPIRSGLLKLRGPLKHPSFALLRLSEEQPLWWFLCPLSAESSYLDVLSGINSIWKSDILTVCGVVTFLVFAAVLTGIQVLLGHCDVWRASSGMVSSQTSGWSEYCTCIRAAAPTFLSYTGVQSCNNAVPRLESCSSARFSHLSGSDKLL